MSERGVDGIAGKNGDQRNACILRQRTGKLSKGGFRPSAQTDDDQNLERRLPESFKWQDVSSGAQ